MRIVLALLLAAVVGPAGGETTPPPTPVRESMALCDRADSEPADAQVALLERGLALAEDAVAAHPTDPCTHFAVFCNLGKLAQRRGIGWSSLGTVRRLRREIDATLALAPDDVPALTAKGAFLATLPRLLGGDPHEADRLLHRALALAPDNAEARRWVARLTTNGGSETIASR
jgi:hypothetical protein